MGRTSFRFPISMLAAGAVFAAAVPALAQPTDLIGARAGQAERDLQNRGYAFDHASGGTQYWWNAGSRECISLYVDNGRYRSINGASASTCNAGRGSSGKKDNTGAVIAGALAIGILAAAAASSKKHHDDDRYDEGNRGDYRSYSPSRGVDCYTDQRACYERGRGYSAYWTNREFRYRY